MKLPSAGVAIGIGVIAIVLFGAGGFSGYFYCKSSGLKGVIKQQKSDASEVMKHEDAKDVVDRKVETIIRERIKTIVDPSKCLDTGSPDDYVDSLLDAERAAESGFN